MSDIERLVNNNTDVRRIARQRLFVIKRERRLKKMRMYIYGFATVAVSTIFFAVIGAVHGLLATAVSVVSLMSASFVLGLYVEARKIGTKSDRS